MGMAASQARLLSITARIHDVEYQAQSIESAKIQLATQQDAVYKEYMDALDATTLTIKTPNALVPATFNNLCSHNRLDLGTLKESYAIRDKYGRLIVEDDVAKGYKDYVTSGFSNALYGISAPQAFALFMLDKNNMIKQESQVEHYREAEDAGYEVLTSGAANQNLKALRESLQELTEKDDIYNITEISKLKKDDPEEYQKKIAEYQDKLTRYLYELYNSKTKDEDGEVLYGAQIVYANAEDDALISAKDLDMDRFNYYVSIFNQIEQCGDCISINEFNGVMGGSAADDSDWLRSKVESGEFTIELVTDNKNGTISMSGTAPSSDTRISYTETTSIDNKAAKKAEAKYEHDLKEINQKDKQLDMSLSKLETQRKALTTEYESVKKVISENVERTFGIFS